MKNKFKNFGPVYVINLNERTDRKKYIKSHFKKYGITDYSFFVAVDGRYDKKEIKKYLHPDSNTSDLRNPEIAVILSHLRAIKYWLDTSDSEYAIFCEDDVDFSTSDFWNFTWDDFIASIKVKYDIIQMSITNPFQIPFHSRRKHKEYSAGCYLITRNYARKLIKKHYIDDKYKVSGTRRDIVADELIYNTRLAYSVGLFTYKNVESNINPEKINGSHKRSIDMTMNYWEKNGNLPLNK